MCTYAYFSGLPRVAPSPLMKPSLENPSRVWVIEADAELELILQAVFEDEGFTVSGCAGLGDVAAAVANGETGVLVVDAFQSTPGHSRSLHQELLPMISLAVPILVLRNNQSWLPVWSDKQAIRVLEDSCLDIEQIILTVRSLLPRSTQMRG